MTYDIYGWVEVATDQDLAAVWTAALNLTEIAGCPDEYSARIFGLAKSADRQNPVFPDRGVPGNCSIEVADELRSISSLEHDEGGNIGFHGYTYATLAELKKTTIAPSTNWASLLSTVAGLQRRHGLSEHEVRFVVWAQW